MLQRWLYCYEVWNPMNKTVAAYHQKIISEMLNWYRDRNLTHGCVVPLTDKELRLRELQCLSHVVQCSEAR